MIAYRTTLALTALTLGACANGTTGGLFPRAPDAGAYAPLDDAAMPPPPYDPEDAAFPPMPTGSDAGIPPMPQSGPRPLRCGRTYDQEHEYLIPSGDVRIVLLHHKDNTTMPSYEGGDFCGDGCDEHVSRLGSGSTLTGVFDDKATFNVQGAMTSESGTGTLVVEACGQEIVRAPLHVDHSANPGFINLPSPAWPVPTTGRCPFTIRAEGGFIYIRAVTTSCSTPDGPPTVDLKANGQDGPLSLAAPADVTLTWTSALADSCTASGAWSGSQAPDGSKDETGLAGGSYTYTITCTNGAGSATDEVTVNVVSGPA